MEVIRLRKGINTLNAELNPICHLLRVLGAHHILHVSRIRVKLPQYNSVHGIADRHKDRSFKSKKFVGNVF